MRWSIAAAAGYRLPGGDDGRLQVRDIPDTSFLTGDEPYIAVHPGAAVPARAWPPLHHAAAVELLIGAGYRVVVTGGPQEQELTATVAVPGALDLGGQTDLRSLAGVLAGASAVVTGNTGPAHLAAAVGTPVVSCSRRWCRPSAGRPTRFRWSCSATSMRRACSAAPASARSPGIPACPLWPPKKCWRPCSG